MWTDSYFQGLYLRLYRDRLLTLEQTEEELEMVRSAFRPQDGPLLDLSCGFGRHAIPLAREGYQIVGLDNQGLYLKEAERASRSAKSRLAWVAGSQAALPFAANTFAGVYCLFNSWGYLGAEESRAEWRAGKRDRPLRVVEDPNFHVLEEVARVLRPGARLLLDLPNRPSLLRLVKQQPRLRQVAADYDIDERFCFVEEIAVLANETTFRLGREKQETGYCVRLYTRGELARWLRRAGLDPEEWSGGDGEPLDGQSVRMVALARKGGA